MQEERKSALIHPLYNNGERTDVTNCRGILLLPVTYKIFSKFLLDRMQAKMEIGK